MPYEIIDSETFGEGLHEDELTVGTLGNSYALVFDGPNDMETVIQFDDVQLKELQMTYQTILLKAYRRSTVRVGSLEGHPEHYGDVGAFLLELTEE